MRLTMGDNDYVAVDIGRYRSATLSQRPQQQRRQRRRRRSLDGVCVGFIRAVMVVVVITIWMVSMSVLPNNGTAVTAVTAAAAATAAWMNHDTRSGPLLSLTRTRSVVVRSAGSWSSRLQQQERLRTRCVQFAAMKKLHSKQADLRRKLELAKQQKISPSSSSSSDDDDNYNRKSTNDGPNPRVTAAETTTTHQQQQQQQQHRQPDAAEIKLRNDRLRFAEMLERQSSHVMDDADAGRYRNAQQEEDEITAVRSDVDRLFEGDLISAEPFEELVSIKTGNAICKRGAKRLVPWLARLASSVADDNNNDADMAWQEEYLKDMQQNMSGDGTKSIIAISSKQDVARDEFVIVLTDPREKSPELRQTIKLLHSNLPLLLQRCMIIVNADSPTENRRWLKKSGLLNTFVESGGSGGGGSGGGIELYSDEKLQFMRAITALGQDRWTMTLFVLAEGRIQRLVRGLDVFTAPKVIQNAVQSYQTERRL